MTAYSLSTAEVDLPPPNISPRKTVQMSTSEKLQSPIFVTLGVSWWIFRFFRLSRPSIGWQKRKTDRAKGPKIPCSTLAFEHKWNLTSQLDKLCLSSWLVTLASGHSSNHLTSDSLTSQLVKSTCMVTPQNQTRKLSQGPPLRGTWGRVRSRSWPKKLRGHLGKTFTKSRNRCKVIVGVWERSRAQIGLSLGTKYKRSKNVFTVTSIALILEPLGAQLSWSPK